MARARADTLTIGLDASVDALAYAARRAVRERLPNLVLLREPVETADLESIAEAVTVHLPWGSLLRGVLAEDLTVFEAICRLLRPGGSLTVMLSVTARDGRAPLGESDVARVARAYRSRGLVVAARRAVTPEDVAAARSSWGRRLGVGSARPGQLLSFIRDGGSS